MGGLTLFHGVLCCAALAISSYALYVELAKEKDEHFEALCDISPQISCSTVLTSKWEIYINFQLTYYDVFYPAGIAED